MRAAWSFLQAIPSTTGWNAWTWPAAPARDWRRRAPAEHAPVFARSGQRWVDTVMRADAMPETRVMSEQGPGPLLPSAAEDPPFPINLQLTETARPAELPRGDHPPRCDFQAGRRYPVVLHVYGGPHHLSVKADARSFVFDQWLADHGCIVVALDNRGTPAPRAGPGSGPSRASSATCRWPTRWPGCRRSAAQLPGAGSRAGRGLRLVVRRLPQRAGGAAPSRRVQGGGGGGAGGRLARLRHPLHRALPRPARSRRLPRIDRSSLLSYAGQLSRPLLIIHGTADDNVYFFHSLKLADALFRAGKRFDFLPLPRVTHQIADPLVREQLWAEVARYLLESLPLGAISRLESPPSKRGGLQEPWPI